jgi:hypothetical protein
MTAEQRTLRLRQDHLDWRVVDDEVIALDGRTSVYLSVNRAGLLLWQALGAGVTRGELVLRLRDAFGLAEAAAQRDVDAFLDELAGRDLLEPPS